LKALLGKIFLKISSLKVERVCGEKRIESNCCGNRVIIGKRRFLVVLLNRKLPVMKFQNLLPAKRRETDEKEELWKLSQKYRTAF